MRWCWSSRRCARRAIDEHEERERGCDLAGGHRQDGVGRPQDTGRDPGLAVDFGGDPAGEQGEEAERPGEAERAQIEAILEQPAADPAHAAPTGDRDHQKPDPDHDPEAEEDRQHRRPLVFGELVETRIAAAPFVHEDQPAKIGHRELEPVRLRLLVGDAEQHQGARFLPFQCPSIAAILAGWCSSVLRPYRSPSTSWAA